MMHSVPQAGQGPRIARRNNPRKREIISNKADGKEQYDIQSPGTFEIPNEKSVEKTPEKPQEHEPKSKNQRAENARFNQVLNFV